MIGAGDSVRVRFVLGRVALILGGLAIGILAVEAGLRIVPIPNRFVLIEQLEDLWENDDELLLHLKPDLDIAITGHPEFRFNVETNSQGLRDGPLEGDYPVVAIGDSFTFGFGVNEDQAWPEQLEQLSGVGVANLGWAGWNSYVYPAALRRHAVPLNAELWLWAFFVNDLRESAGAAAFVESGKTNYKDWSDAIDNVQAIDQFPYNLRTVQLLVSLMNPDFFLLPDSGDRIYDDGRLQFRYGRYSWEMSDPASAEVQRGWEITQDALVEASNLADENGARLVVIFVPSREHVYWPFIEGAVEDLNVAQLDGVEMRLSEFCNQNGIGYINLLPGMRTQALQGEMLYFPNDGHWNGQGHSLAAELVYFGLSAEGILRDLRGISN